MRRYFNRGIIIVALLIPATAWAEGGVTLQDALAFEDEGQLVQALDAFRLVLHQQGNSQEDIATIYLHLALLQQASGERESARDSMYRLLAVEPEPELPVSAPPDVAELLEEARRLWSGRRLRAELNADEEVEHGEDWPVRVVVHDDVPGMVTGVALVSEGAVVTQQEGRGPYELAVPSSTFGADGETVQVDVRLLDEHGGTVWEGASVALSYLPDGSSTTEVIEDPDPSRTVSSRRAPFWVAGWVLLGTGLVLGGSGGALVGVDRRPTGEQRTVDAGVEEEFLDTDVAGWLLIGVGSAALITGIILLILSRNRGPDNESTARLDRVWNGTVGF